MTHPSIHIILEPSGHEIICRSGALLVEAAARAGLVVNTPCGGAGTCGKCKVRFIEGAPTPGPTEQERLGAAACADGWRLACQTRLEEDARIETPPGSLFCGQHQIQTVSDQDHARRDRDTDICKCFIEMTPPVLGDDIPDLIRMERALREVLPEWGSAATLTAPPTVLRTLGVALRETKFKGTVALRGTTLIDYEAGAAAASAYAIAFDIGTTTLVGALLDMTTGEERAVAAAMNPQTAYGDDVLSRISVAGRDDNGLRELHRCVVHAARDMTAALCARAGVSPRHVYNVAVAGNTTMQHLFCGFSPASLGVAPFVPLFGRGMAIPAHGLDLGIHPRAQLYIFPVIGGFVGGDTVAGLLATQMLELDGPTLMVDVGTNGEIVLAHEGQLLAASTAAGPAFEGARISCGMRAADGAVEKVTINHDIELGVIGDVPPAGICGSGLIDLCGELLKVGAITPDGRLLAAEETNGNLSGAVRARLRQDAQGEPECVLHESNTVRVALTQRDVRELQLGAGAIRAGIHILLKQAGLRPGDLKQVLIAGGFGSFIRRDNAQRIGLIPHELPHERIRFTGNVAFNGAKWAALSQNARNRAEELARMTTHVDLSQDEDFALEFAMAMRFPEISVK